MLLKPVRVSRVCLVALEAKGEVVALSAIEVEHLLWNRLHAAVAAEPHIISLLFKLLFSLLLSLLRNLLSNLLFEVLLELVLILQVIMSLKLQLISLVLE